MHVFIGLRMIWIQRGHGQGSGDNEFKSCFDQTQNKFSRLKTKLGVNNVLSINRTQPSR